MIHHRDIIISIIIGVITGAIWAGVFTYLEIFKEWKGINPTWFLMPLFPVVFVLGLHLGKWISRWKYFFISFSRYAMIGFLNTGIDFGIFNLLMLTTGTTEGIEVSLFKTVSFIFATVNSYFWNKFWTFEAGSSGGGAREFMKFLMISLIGISLNVGIASIGFSLDPIAGLNRIVWNNISVAFATISNLIWNFVGYKLIVFKFKKKSRVKLAKLNQ